MALCPCCPGDDEEEEQDATFEKVAGPAIERRCTDVCWLVLFFVYCAAFLVFYYQVYRNSNTACLFHGTDHEGNICGLNDKRDVGKVFFPQLHADLSADPRLRHKYGICVESCPKQGTTVPDPSTGKHWFVPLPQLEIANRCIPYAKAYRRNGTKMCAWPQCKKDFPKTQEPTEPREVCGNKLDGTESFWPLGEPDHWLVMGWKEEGVPTNVVEKRLEILRGDEAEADDECEVVVARDMAFKMAHKDEGVTYELLTRFTGELFHQSQQLYHHLPLILTLGLAGSLVLSMVLIMLFPCCMKGMVVTLIILLFTVLIVVDYALFVQAELIEGRIGQYFTNALGKTGLSDVLENGLEVVGLDADMGRLATLLAKAEGSDNQLKNTYRWLAICLAIVIIVLLCLLVAIRKNFALLFGLYSAAARTLREMPSLVLLPFVTLASLAVWTSTLLHTVLGALTIEDATLTEWLEKLGFADDDEPERLNQAKKGTAWLLLFSFLWVYFYHVAIFQITLAGGISKWYFFRKDSSDSAGTGTHSEGWFFGRPLILAFWRTMRFHLGSAAAGSFILALFTMPRVVLEYIDQEIKRSQADNPLTRTLIPCVRCCLACFDRFLKALTEYAYINVAITGKGFCRSANASIKLLVSHPVQVALDRVASASLQTMACLLVPFCLLAITYCIVKSWLIVGFFVFLLSFMVTRMCIGVFDVCISTLMVCAMLDKDSYGGRYAPSEIRGAMGLPRRTTVHSPTEGGIEMSFTPTEESAPAEEQ